MFVPRGVNKLPEPFFSSESPTELFPVRGKEGRREIIPDFLKPRLSQDLGRVIETLFLVCATQELLEIVSTKRFIPQKVRPVRQVVGHILMLPLFPRALNSSLPGNRPRVDMTLPYRILSQPSWRRGPVGAFCGLFGFSKAGRRKVAGANLISQWLTLKRNFLSFIQSLISCKNHSVGISRPSPFSLASW